MARRPSTIKRLPREIREEIGGLREDGHTIDEILAHLRQLGADVSRSALGRHIKGLDELGERIRRSREVADTLVRRLGNAPESKQARLNIELMHAAIQDLFMGAGGGGEDGEGGEAGPITLDPMGAMLMAKSLDHLAKASKAGVEEIAKIREQADKEAARKAVKAAEKALGGKHDDAPVDRAAVLKRIREEVYGITA